MKNTGNCRKVGFVLLNLAFCFLPFPVFSQAVASEKSANTQAVQEPAYGFELFVKRQTYEVVPYEYTSSTRDPHREFLIQNSNLEQNSKVLVPMALRYEGKNRKYWLETSFYEIEIVNSNTYQLKHSPSSSTLSRKYFPALTRSEAEIGAFYIFTPLSGLQLGIGGGGKNINKYTYGKNNLSGAFQEYYLTYGPQLGLRLEWKFLSNLSLSVMLDAFYTQGNRFSDNVLLDNDHLQIAGSIAGKKGLYRGVESDIALYYRFFGKFRIGIGYNRIDSYFSPLHNNSILYTFPDPLRNRNPAEIKIRRGIQNGNFETLKGFYAVASVSF